MLLSVSIMPCATDVGVVTVADLVKVSKGSMEPPFQGEARIEKNYFIWCPWHLQVIVKILR